MHPSAHLGAGDSALGLPAQLLPSSQPNGGFPHSLVMALPLPGPLGCFRIRSAVSGSGLRGRGGGGGGGGIAEPRRRRSSDCGTWVPPLSRVARPRFRASSFSGRHDRSLEDLRQSSLKPACLSRLHWSLCSGTPGLSPGGRGARPPPSLRSAALPPQPGSRYSETLPSPPSTSAPRARAGSAF